jgi:hypothetical protein
MHYAVEKLHLCRFGTVGEDGVNRAFCGFVKGVAGLTSLFHYVI